MFNNLVENRNEMWYNKMGEKNEELKRISKLKDNDYQKNIRCKKPFNTMLEILETQNKTEH